MVRESIDFMYSYIFIYRYICRILSWISCEMARRHNNKRVWTVRKGTAIAECKCINNSSYSIGRDIGSALRLVSACAKCLQFAQFYQAIINFPFIKTHNANKMYSVHTMSTLRYCWWNALDSYIHTFVYVLQRLHTHSTLHPLRIRVTKPTNATRTLLQRM